MTKQDILAGLFPDTYSREGNASKTEKILFYIVLAISFLTVVTIYFNANSPYDTGDGIVHYQIAKYSWKHPHLLLYLWGKPFFTLISSPFAQFGLKGMYIFQALNAVAISWFIFGIASKINLKYKWTIPVFVFFAPVFFSVMNSGLVEISFGTMFMFSAWLVFKKRYYASALVASIIPFVRPEAYVVMPLLTAIYIYRKKYFAIPLLAAGFIFYTLIGYVHFKDLLWIINQNYQLVGDNYAGMKGSYFHYFKIYYAIWGTAYAIPFLIGIGTISIQSYRLFQRNPKHEFVEEVFVLFLGCTIGCFVLHSLLCGMPGILNNLGMVRYMAALIPSSALIALIGLNIIGTPALSKITSYKTTIVVVMVILVIVSPFTQSYFPFKTYNEQHVMKQIASYIKTTLPGFKKVCFLHPTFPVFANLDPYDDKKVVDLLIGNTEHLNKLPDSTLLIWDSHFMKDDGKIQLDWLNENPNFILLKHYAYGLEKFPFEACLFIRSNNPNPVQNEVPVEIVSPQGAISYKYTIDTTSYNFENSPVDFPEWAELQTALYERNVVLFTPEFEYGPKFNNKSGTINLGDGVKSVNLKFNINPVETVSKLVSVVEIRNNDSIVSWQGLTITQTLNANEWNSVNLYHSFQEPIVNNNLEVTFYFWNNRKQKFYIDNLQIDFGCIINQN